MELISKFKKAFAVLATVALVSTNVPVAFAQTFNDVATDHWAFDYVEQLVDEGVFDVADNFRPDVALNRAELVKIVITAVDGLAGYEAPATPTFDDVAADAWFFDYVEAAVQLDIVAGYTDAKGNLTGKFGPSDTVNRAQATKILVNAFGVPTTLEPAAPFSDVPESAWFYEYVTTAYNQSILDGYDNGKFGPADPVTRAQVAKLTVNAQDPVERVAAEDEEEAAAGDEEEAAAGDEEEAAAGDEEEAAAGDEEEEVLSEGDLEVSLNDTTPAGTTLPTGSSSVDLASFDLTAADDDVRCTNIVITRGGVGQVGDWAELFLYDGINRLTTGRTVNNDTNVATFPLIFTVDAGTTKTLRLVGRVGAAAAANNQHYFYLASAADLTCNAQSVAGDFPVAGSTFTVGGVAVNTLTFTVGTQIAQPLIGAKDAEVSSFRTTAGATNDIALHQLTLTQGGTLSASRMTNCKLLRGTDVLATAEGFGDKERITFVLETPYVVPKGQVKNWYVRCDLDGGRATDNLQIYLDETSDAVTVDQQYGHGANITNTFALANLPAVPVTLKGGKVTITDNGPAAKQVASNITNIELLNFSVTTDRDLTVKDTTVHVRISNDGTDGGRPNIPALAAFAAATTVAQAAAVLVAGTTNQYDLDTTADQGANYQVGDTLRLQNAAATTTFYVRLVALNNANTTVDNALRVASQNDLVATNINLFNIVEVNPYALLKNLKIVDLDKGSTLQGPLTLVSQGTLTTEGANSVYLRQFTEDYELKAGETRHLSVAVDTDQNMPAGYQVTAHLDFDTTEASAAGTGFIKDVAANENVVVADIVGNELVSKPMTIAQNSLALGLSASPNPSSTTFIKGQKDVSALGVNFTAGDAGPITLKKLVFHVIADGSNIADFDTNNDGLNTSALLSSEMGDIDPRTLVASAALWDGTNMLAEPKGLTISDGTYSANETDEANVTFDSLNIAIPAGTTKTLSVRINLQSSVTTVAAGDRDHTAVFIRSGTNDVTAEDKDANAVTPTGGTVNAIVGATDTFNRLVTVELSGTLTVRENSSPQASIKVAGATKQLVGQYEFASSREAWNVNEVTVINDAAGAFATAVDTSSVRQVWIEYPDVNGVTQTLNQSLAVGIANFSNLNPSMYVKKDDVAVIKVYADIQLSDFGQSLSGQSFRLGLRDDNANSADGTFRAVGAASGESLYNPTISGAASVYEHFVRFTVPTVAKDGGDEPLTDGAKDLYKVKITADPARGLELKRLVFRINAVFTAGQNTDDLTAFRIREGATGTDLLNTESSIFGRELTDAAGDGSDAVDLDGAGTFDQIDNLDDAGGSNEHYVVVDFVTARTVSAGASKTFILKASVSGASQTGERVSTYIADDTVNQRSAGAGTLAKFPGCWSLIEPGVGAAAEVASPGLASAGTAAYVITDLDCDAVQDAGEFALLVAGIGNGTTGVTAQAIDFGGQVVKTIGTEAQGVLAGTILRGQLGLFDTSNLVANDHFFWFDEDADGVPDTTEVALSDHLTAGDYTDVDPASVSDVTGTAGFQTPVVAGVVEYAYVTMGTPLLVFDAAAGAAQAVVLFEGDLGNNTNDANLEPGIEITGEVVDLATALDEILVGAGSLTNFIWSDKSSTAPTHSENSTDWTTGFLVNTLATDARTMSY